MKNNSQKGSVAPVVIAIVVLLIAGGVYWGVKSKDIPNTNSDTNSTISTAPVITSISPTSGPIGTVIELKGSNLIDRKGDQEIRIMNSDDELELSAQFAPILIERIGSSNNVSMKFTLDEKLCIGSAPNTGGPCANFMTIVPGKYTIHVETNKFMDDAQASNKVEFTITN